MSYLTYLPQDTRYALRALSRAPGFAITAVLTLALGIGANAAVFSIIDRATIRTPAGVEDARSVWRLEQRYSVALTRESRRRDTFSHPEFEALTRAELSDVELGAYSLRRADVRTAQLSKQFEIASVAGDYFGALGVAPAAGRFFTPEERDAVGPMRIAVIGDHLWKAAFNKSPEVIGASIWVESRRYEIVGVARQGFRGLGLVENDLWVPFGAMGDALDREARSKSYDLRLRIVAHLPPERRTALLDAANRTLRVLNVVRDPAASAELLSVTERLDPRTRGVTLTTMGSLLGAAMTLLLVACANVGNLMRIRSWQRRREIAIRVAMGISPGRLVAHAVIESLLIGLTAGVVATLIASWTARALRIAVVPEMASMDGLVDLRVGAVAMALAVLAGTLTGAISAWRAFGADVSPALRGSEGAVDVRSTRVKSGALLIQTTFATVLLAAAGLFVQSFLRVANQDIGYDYDDVSIVAVPYSRLMNDAETKTVFEAAAARIQKLPQTEAVAVVFPAPLQSLASSAVFLPDRDSVPTIGGTPTAVSAVSPDFFRVLGVRLIQGRTFADVDGRSSEPVVVVSARMAKVYWPNEDPIGRCIIVQVRTSVCRRVVGVVEDVNSLAIIEGPSLRFYVPIDQAPKSLATPQALLVRAKHGHGSEVLPQVREALDVIGRGRMWDFKTFSALLDPELHPWRSSALLFAGLGALALTIAGVGIYGTVAYATSQRTREIGVRLALGADRLDVVRLVISQALAPVIAGGILGLGVATIAGYFVRAALYNVTPVDALSLVAAATLLVVTSLVACVVPVSHAVRVDPALALASD